MRAARLPQATCIQIGLAVQIMPSGTATALPMAGIFGGPLRVEPLDGTAPELAPQPQPD
jgi:hypothetical protein